MKALESAAVENNVAETVGYPNAKSDSCKDRYDTIISDIRDLIAAKFKERIPDFVLYRIVELLLEPEQADWNRLSHETQNQWEDRNMQIMIEYALRH